MRAGSILVVLALLLAPTSLAQEPSPSVRATVVLEGAPPGALRVELVATAPVRITLPGGNATDLAAGRPYSYTVDIAREVDDLLLISRNSVLPPEATADRLIAPEGWGGIASNDTLVFARDLQVSSPGSANVRLATLGAPDADDLAFLARGVPYLAAQHPSAALDVLIVRAPPGHEGIAEANGTLVLASDEPVEEMARHLARLHQRYRVVEVSPASASWFREGEERLLLQMSLLASGLRNASEVEDAFARARAVADPDARLPQAAAGTTVSRQKGLVVVRALDVAMREATGGAEGLADLVAELEAEAGPRLDSTAIEAAAVRLGGAQLALFFERYVYGTDWPATPGVRDAADLFVRSLELRPARANPGEQVVAAYSVVNRGTQRSDQDLVLRVDGAPLRSVPMSLDVGARREETITLVADGPGIRVVSLGPRDAALQVLTPARLVLARTSATPEEPRAHEPFTLLVYVENLGERAGRGRVEVYDGERLVQRTTDALVEGLATDALTLPLRLDEPGLHVLRVRLAGEHAAGRELEHPIEVRFAGERQETPGGGALWAPLLAAALAVALSRGARGTRPR